MGPGLPQRLQPLRAPLSHRRERGGVVDAAPRRPALFTRRRARDHRVGAHLGHVRALKTGERRAAQALTRRARRGSRDQAVPYVRRHDQDALPRAVLPRVHASLPAASGVHPARRRGGCPSQEPRRRPRGPGHLGLHLQPAQVARELGARLAGFRAHAFRAPRARPAQRAQHRVQVHTVQRGPTAVPRG